MPDPANESVGCVVDSTRKELLHKWQAAEEAARPVRFALAQATRMATEITLGRATATTLHDLELIAQELSVVEPEAAAILNKALSEFRSEWERHAAEGACTAGVCFERPTAPCRSACPAGINIPGFLAHIGRGQYDEALRLIAEENPLPHICGLVCPAPCEDACLRRATGAALFIRPLKAVAAKNSSSYWTPEKKPTTGKRVAVVGSGPSGLTLAYSLTAMGHQVEIFETREKAGGMMRYGIPRYRLPAAVLDGEIEHMKSLGIVVHTGYQVKSATEFRDRGFDATYLAVGLQLSKGMGIEGEDLPFVIGGMDFLGGVGAGKNPRVGPRVIVVGGGNSAVDAAMTALRQGAEHVYIVYRRRRSNMPASPHEVSMCLAEGVELLELWMPERVLPGHKMIFKRNPIATEEEVRASGSELTLDVDHVLVGIGQDSELSLLAGTKVESKKGQIVADKATLATAEPGIFAGGDIAHGAGTVVEAIMAGKKAAESIDAYLMGDKSSRQPARLAKSALPLVQVDAEQRSTKRRPPMPELDAKSRNVTYEQIELGYSEADAQLEATRCLRCDLCIGCGMCELVCSETGAEALRMVETASGRRIFDDFNRPISRCIGCGACAAVCPTGAIRVEDKDGLRSTIITGTVVRTQPLQLCAACHKPLTAEVQWEAIRGRSANDAGMPALCGSCKRIKTALAIMEMEPLEASFAGSVKKTAVEPCEHPVAIMEFTGASADKCRKVN